MNLAGIFFGSFLIAFSGAAAPGPLLAIAVGRTLKRGFRAGPLLVTGHSLLELAVVVLIIHGLSNLISRPGVEIFLSLFGGGILFAMGFLTVRRRGNVKIGEGSVMSRGSDIWYGALGSIANPYWSIWWGSIGMAYMAIAVPRGLYGIAFFFLGHIFADYLWYSAVSYSVAKGKKRLPDTFYRNVLTASGVLLAGFGLWFLGRGAGGLLGML